MDRQKLLAGIALAVGLVGCQPASQGGEPTPSGMPADTMMTDTMMTDTMTAAERADGPTGGQVAAREL